MSELIIKFPSLLDLLDFIEVTGNAGQKIGIERYYIRGFFSDAEIELAQNGMQAQIKGFDKIRKQV